MTRNSSECTRISPDSCEKPMIFLASASKKRATRDGRQARGGCSSRLLRNARCSAVKFCRRVTSSVARALRLVSKKRSADNSGNCRKQKCAPPSDLHQNEAVEECIRFMNSSSGKYP